MSAVSSADLLSCDHQIFNQHVIRSPEEGFIFFELMTNKVLKKILFDHVLFALPITNAAPMRAYYLPNPIERFCIPLQPALLPSSSATAGTSSPSTSASADIVHAQQAAQHLPKTNWFRNKKLRKYASQFDLVIKQDLYEDLIHAMQYHQKMQEGTWLTKPFISQLNDIAKELAATKDRNHQMYSFSLKDKKTQEIVAMTFGFATGGIFEDYTMAAFVRDHRSCGAILNRIVGYVLQEAGFSLWYWGYQLGYMHEYCEHYHARNFSKAEFYRIHHQTKHFQHKPFEEIALPFDMSLSCN